jgi:hypothetical protein
MPNDMPAPAEAAAVDPKDEKLLGDFHKWLIANDLNICSQSFGAWRPVGVNVTRFLRERGERQRGCAP